MQYKEMLVFVEFLGWFEDGFDLFIAMEYLRLGDLEKNLPASGKLLEAEVKVITKQILDGLHIMHLESFAHRDLKPQVSFSSSNPISSGHVIDVS